MLNDVLQRNRDWSAKRQAQEPGYFTRLAALQAPEFFWIGCSDSRVPANVVAGQRQRAAQFPQSVEIGYQCPIAISLCCWNL